MSESPNKEISALLQLVDDPDEEVYHLVSSKIVGYGKTIIPNLEHIWETSIDQQVQERVERLIHRLHFTDLKADLANWAKEENPSMLQGAILASKYQYPDLNQAALLVEVEKIRRTVWLELNNYLTPLEQINILSSVVFNYIGLKGTEIKKANPNDFLFNKIIETKQGNQFGNGLLFLVFAEMLDLPIKAIQIPGFFALAYFKTDFSFEDPDFIKQKISYYFDPGYGQIFSQADVDTYFEKLAGSPAKGSYFEPLDNKQALQRWILEYSRCFDNSKDQEKKNELLELAALLG